MKITHQGLKKKLWKVFSEYIRRRDADWKGYVKCCTCGKRMHWKEADAGHYKSKNQGLAVYFLEYNVHPQCTGCNRFRHGNLTSYAIYLQERYGDDILKKIEWSAHQHIKINSKEYENLIKLYKEKIRLLDNFKN